jgi:hypothetical protein
VVRQNAKNVLAYIGRNYIAQSDGQVINSVEMPLCMICAATAEMTREHIIPRWLFLKRTDAFFTINLNGLNQTYNKATIPVCRRCNSELLNELERAVQQLLTKRDVEVDPFVAEETAVLIRWLELIDYKLQIYNISRKFKTSKTAGHIPLLEDIPLYLLLQNKNYSPFQVLTAIRRSLNRQAVAGKWNKLNSLVVFKTSNQGHNFLHTIDEFIFLEMPQYQIALFYFYNMEFDSVGEAHDQAMEILRKVY